MPLQELWFYLKKNKLFIGSLYVYTFLFFLTLGTFLAFIDQLDYEADGLQEVYEGKAFYELLDGYYEGEDYAEFTSRPDALSILKSYYQALSNSTDFDYLAMFDHYVLLQDNGLPEHFITGYEYGAEKHQEIINSITHTAVKSAQMNLAVPQFFGLKVAEGRTWSSADFKGATKTIPIILGSSYRNNYQVGNHISLQLYLNKLEAEVIGFLEENSKVYYKGNAEFYLDDYVLLPYIDYENPNSEADKKFQIMNYFARVNGSIVLENTPLNTSNTMQRIDSIAQSTGFNEYSFIKFNPNYQPYRGMMTVIQENRNLVWTLFVFALLINLIVINLLLYLQQRRRLSYLAVHSISGATKGQMIAMQIREIGVISFSAYLSSFLILFQLMQIGTITIQAYLLVICVFITLLACLFPSYQILVRPLATYIRKVDE